MSAGRKRSRLEELTEECLRALSLIEDRQPGLTFISRQLRDMVEYAYANKAIGTLNAMKKEILASLDAMSQNNRKEILNSLPNSWRHIKNNSARQVQAVLRRGEIKSKREYRLVLEEVEKSYDDPDRSEEVKSLNTLLAAFEKKHPKGP